MSHITPTWHASPAQPVPVLPAAAPITIHHCMLCGRQTHQNKPFGQRIAVRQVTSGPCLECAPAWLRQCGMPEEQIATFGKQAA